MNDPKKPRFAVDLDEIERQMRETHQTVAQQRSVPLQPSPGTRSEPRLSDPLSELARIVGQNDPFDSLLAAADTPRSTGREGGYSQPHDPYAVRAVDYSAPQTTGYPGYPSPSASHADPYAQGAGYDQYDDQNGVYVPEAPHGAAYQGDSYRYDDYREDDYAADPATSYAPHADAREARYAQAPADAGGYRQDYPSSYAPQAYEDAYSQEPEGYDDYDPDGEDDDYEEEDEARSRWPFILGGLLVVALLGGGGYWYLRGMPLTPSGEPPVITANTEPTKVPPQTSDGIEIPDQNREIYNQGNTNSTTRVVDREEQPVDVSQSVSQSSSSDQSAPSNGPRQTREGQSGYDFGEPKRVQTLTVRSDGSIIGANGQALPDSGPRSVPSPQDFMKPAGQNNADRSAPSSANASATANRPVSSPTTQTADAAPPPTTAPVTPSVLQPPAPPVTAPAPPVRPSQPAAQAAGGPLQLQPNVRSAPQASPPRQVAAVTESDASPTEEVQPRAPQGAGGHAVQLGIASTEAEAKATFARLQQRYASELNGFAPIIRKTESNGNTFYRIRVGPMSQDDARSICARLTAAGGACYPTKN